jgi:uncharacterized protein
VIEFDWEQFCSSVVTVKISDAVATAAGQLCADVALRGADGVHFASALALGDIDCVMVGWDQRLAGVARVAELGVALAVL